MIFLNFFFFLVKREIGSKLCNKDFSKKVRVENIQWSSNRRAHQSNIPECGHGQMMLGSFLALMFI